MAESKVCVSCLSSDMIFNIFDTHECEGNEEIYSEMLKFCLDITISEESAAKYMCEKCILLLRAVYIFKQDILRNVRDFEAQENEILEILETASIASSQDTENFGTVLYCMELDGTNTTNEIPNKNFHNTDDNTEVKKFVVKDGIFTKYINKKGNKGEILKSDKKLKVPKELKVNNKPIAERNESNSDSVFACDKCPKQFKDKPGLQRHLRTHLHGPFACRLCDKVFDKVNTRDAHSWRAHSTTPFRCAVCPQRFRTLHKRLLHLQEAHNINPEYKCAQCDKVFSDTSARWQHVRSYHERVRKHRCDRCSMAFCRRRELLNHMASVHGIGEKRNVCDICGKSFYFSSVFQNHMKRHFKTDDKIYKCLECQTEFKNQEELNDHLKTHLKTEIANENETEEGTVIVDYGEYSNDTVYFDISETGSLYNTVDFS